MELKQKLQSRKAAYPPAATGRTPAPAKIRRRLTAGGAAVPVTAAWRALVGVSTGKRVLRRGNCKKEAEFEGCQTVGFELFSLQRPPPLPDHPISGMLLLANVEDPAYAVTKQAFSLA